MDQDTPSVTIQVASDLHLEHRKHHGANDVVRKICKYRDGVDALVLAGDIWNLQLRLTADYLRRFVDSYPAVIYVPGNHEAWGWTIEQLHDELMEIEAKERTFHWLRPSKSVTVNGRRFIGGTMWFPYDEDAEPFKHWMNDFSFISDQERIYTEFAFFKAMVVSEAKWSDVVVSHHTPSVKSIAKQFEGSPINPFFCVPEMESLITTLQPRMWIHGHTHDAFDYYIDDTRVVCNPGGYPGELSGKAFRPDARYVITGSAVQRLADQPDQ
jgi:Icc-related predicted phosphoesterase